MNRQKIEELLCNAGWLPYARQKSGREQAGFVVSLCPEGGVGVHYLHVSHYTAPETIARIRHEKLRSYAAVLEEAGVLVIPTPEVTSRYKGKLVQPEWLYCPNIEVE